MSTGTGISFATAITEEPASGGGGTPADPTTSVQFNDAGKFGGNAGFTFIDDGETGETLTVGNAVIRQNGGAEITTIVAATDQDGIDATVSGGDANGKGKYGGTVSITGGDATTSGSYGGSVYTTAGDGAYYGGAVRITGGSGNTYGGGVAINGGNSTSGRSGIVAISGGVSTNGTGADVFIRGGQSTNAKAGNISITALDGAGGKDGGSITLDVGTPNGSLIISDANVANGTVACVLTATSGPTGAQTAVQGWLKVKIGGTDRFVPFW